MNLIRKHKISQINNDPLTGVDKDIIDFIEDSLSNLIIFEDNKFPDSIFYMKNGDVLLEHNIKTNILWCRYNYFWEVLYNEYDMEYCDIQDIMKYMVEQSLKIKVGTPQDLSISRGWLVKHAFNK